MFLLTIKVLLSNVMLFRIIGTIYKSNILYSNICSLSIVTIVVCLSYRQCMIYIIVSHVICSIYADILDSWSTLHLFAWGIWLFWQLSCCTSTYTVSAGKLIWSDTSWFRCEHHIHRWTRRTVIWNVNTLQSPLDASSESTGNIFTAVSDGHHIHIGVGSKCGNGMVDMIVCSAWKLI